MIIPRHVEKNYEVIKEKNNGNYNVFGKLSCCASSEFEVEYCGKEHKNLFGRKSFMQDENRVVLHVKCHLCKRRINLFNSATDGYDNCVENHRREYTDEPKLFNSFVCDKCNSNNFEIRVNYEYPDDLETLNIPDKDNSFTWIQVSLKCNNCKKRYTKLIDFEMG